MRQTGYSDKLSVSILCEKILNGELGIHPENMSITGASYIYQTTRFPGAKTKYRNYYVLMRIESYFGACCHTPEQLEMEIADELSGIPLITALKDVRLPVKIAAMDVYLGVTHPHSAACSRVVDLPGGTPVKRALYRDTLVAEVAQIKASEKVALIGVVNPLVEAIKQRGGICMPCDLQMEETQWGEKVERDMEKVMDRADRVICTGMTLSTGTFDRIVDRVTERQIPLIVYAQTGSALVAQFVGNGVTALVAEPFPFSQLSAVSTQLYCYGY
ncbi:MAG: hypothetical protein LBD93_02625 [Treponema sp.]|jgi:hypothetical protein|nr:hypothetical protein [Treponema sp.]